MLGWYRRLPARVRGWIPSVAFAAVVTLLTGVLGLAVGAASAPATSIAIRPPGSAAPDLSAVDLFVHNAGIAVRSALGILTGGVYTTYVLLVNGFVLGATLADAADVLGWGRAVLAIAPHGVLEIPAIWLSGAIGLRWLAFVWKVGSGDRDRVPGPWLLLESLALTGLALLLLFVAALVEATVSVHLV